MTVYFLQVSKQMKLWDMLQSGGALMIPLGLLFVIALFFFFERYIAIKKAAKLDDNFMKIIRDHIASGNISAAKTTTKNTRQRHSAYGKTYRCH
jgi:biopolymer transport protein ExbB